MTDVTAFSIDRMAERTGLSRSYLYEQLKAGNLGSLKIGKRRLVTVEQEAAFLARFRQDLKASVASAQCRDAARAARGGLIRLTRRVPTRRLAPRGPLPQVTF